MFPESRNHTRRPVAVSGILLPAKPQRGQVVGPTLRNRGRQPVLGSQRKGVARSRCGFLPDVGDSNGRVQQRLLQITDMDRKRFPRAQPLFEPSDELLRHAVGGIGIVRFRRREVQRSQFFEQRPHNPALKVLARQHAVIDILRHALTVNPVQIGGQAEHFAQGTPLHFARHGRTGGPCSSFIDRIHVDAPDVTHQLRRERIDPQNHVRQQLLAEFVVTVASRKPLAAVRGDVFQVGELAGHALEQVVAEILRTHPGIVNTRGVLREETTRVALLRSKQAAQLRNLVLRRHGTGNRLVKPLHGQIVVGA